MFIGEIVALIDKLKEYKWITPIQHEKTFEKLNPLLDMWLQSLN